MEKRDWAIAHLYQMGNKDPKEDSIREIIELLEDTDKVNDDDQLLYNWIRRMYDRQVKGYFRTVEDIPNE